MRLPGDQCEGYLRLLHHERSALVVLTNSQLRVVFGDLRVCEPITVDLPVPHGNRILLKLEHLAETSPTGSFYERVYPWLFLRAEADGFIHPDRTPLVEASVGNAGTAFAYRNRPARLGTVLSMHCQHGKDSATVSVGHTRTVAISR